MPIINIKLQNLKQEGPVMDILGLGILVYNGKDSSFSLSF
jgi:hypothetical protein